MEDIVDIGKTYHSLNLHTMRKLKLSFSQSVKLGMYDIEGSPICRTFAVVHDEKN